MIDATCLCGAVAFHIDGPVRDVMVCHCSVCRRLHGGAAAYSSCAADDLEIEGEALRWFEIGGAEYGFCADCGARMFWRRAPVRTVSFNAALLPAPTGLTTMRHIWVGSAGDYEDLSTSLPCEVEGT